VQNRMQCKIKRGIFYVQNDKLLALQNTAINFFTCSTEVNLCVDQAILLLTTGDAQENQFQTRPTNSQNIYTQF